MRGEATIDPRSLGLPRGWSALGLKHSSDNPIHDELKPREVEVRATAKPVRVTVWPRKMADDVEVVALSDPQWLAPYLRGQRHDAVVDAALRDVTEHLGEERSTAIGRRTGVTFIVLCGDAIHRVKKRSRDRRPRGADRRQPIAYGARGA